MWLVIDFVRNFNNKYYDMYNVLCSCCCHGDEHMHTQTELYSVDFFVDVLKYFLIAILGKRFSSPFHTL